MNPIDISIESLDLQCRNMTRRALLRHVVASITHQGVSSTWKLLSGVEPSMLSPKRLFLHILVVDGLRPDNFSVSDLIPVLIPSINGTCALQPLKPKYPTGHTRGRNREYAFLSLRWTVSRTSDITPFALHRSRRRAQYSHEVESQRGPAPAPGAVGNG